MSKQGLSVAVFVVLACVIAPTVRAAVQTPPLDVCQLLTKAEAGALLGADVTDATPEPARGSLLGGCKYGSAAGVITLNARPAREFDASVKAYKDLQSVDGAGAGVKTYYSPTVGMLMSQTGKAYFIHAMIVGGKAPKGAERVIALAKKIVAKG